MDQPLDPPVDQTRPEKRTCEWCKRDFYRRCMVGRRPRFCRPTCRSRASECRRGLQRGNEPWYPTPRLVDPPPVRDLGISYVKDYSLPDGFWRQHGLLLGAPIDVHGRALTLCGTYAHASFGMFPQVPTRANCRTCLRMARGPNARPRV